MGRKCVKDWNCTKRIVALLNNLKLAPNRRARIGKHIVATPYDILFQKAAIWMLQMAEDISNILA